MEEMILSLRGIRKSFGDAEVLKGISLDVKQGEFITLLGSSGCGKTTTLRIIAGLEQPDEGQVILEGKDVTREEPHKRDVNTVFQSYALFPHMDVASNVAYGLKIRKVPKEEQKKRVKEVLQLVQLEGFGKRKPSELSGGQRQRVAIARAIVNNPRVLLLDEPLGALDLQLRRQMQLELKRLQKKLGITFIYITHDQEEAINMSDRIVVMNAGSFEQVGTPDEVYHHPRTSFVAKFVGSANIIHEEGKTLAVRSENLLFAKQGASDKYCVRNGAVKEKSFAGGLLRVVFVLEDGTELTASRHGIDTDVREGEQVKIGWLPDHAVELEDDLPEEGTGGRMPREKLEAAELKGDRS